MPHTKLAEIVGREPTRSEVITACVAVVDDEVRSKGGLSGVAIKGAYATVKAIKPGFVAGVVDALFDEWIARLEPHHVSWRAAGSGTFSAHLISRSEEVAEDLLAVTDGRARATRHTSAAKIYDRLRPSAKSNVAAAVPRLAPLLDRHVSA